jgi:hypothetical protein
MITGLMTLKRKECSGSASIGSFTAPSVRSIAKAGASRFRPSMAVRTSVPDDRTVIACWTANLAGCVSIHPKIDKHQACAM